MSLWRDQAACTDSPWDIWFPEDAKPRSLGRTWTNQARAICDTCPVIAECLSAELGKETAPSGDPTSAHSRYGIRGGLTADERADLAEWLAARAARFTSTQPVGHRGSLAPFLTPPRAIPRLTADERHHRAAALAAHRTADVAA